VRDDSPQWHEVGPPASSAEAEALRAIKSMLPDGALVWAWSNLSFIGVNGRLAETDLFLDDRGPVGTHHHRETVTEVPHPDRISVSAQDVFLRQVVLACRQCDGRVTQHDRKVTCDYGLGAGATDYRATSIHVH